MRKMEFEGAWKTVIVRLPISLCEKIDAAIEGKKGGVGREIRKRLESTFTTACPLAMIETVTNNAEAIDAAPVSTEAV